MLKAAVPDYLGSEFSAASPGLHFSLLLSVWTSEWEKSNEASKAVQTKITSVHTNCMKAVCKRMELNAKLMPNMFSRRAESTAPFTTGLGNEHPLENGFAFLNPYGLPYLPGSSVKGVVRRSAKELASGNWGDSVGWSNECQYTIDSNGEALSMIDLLFGIESDTQPQFQGALSFWDVIPSVKQKLNQPHQLAIDVMTPHQAKYYQNGCSPHEFNDPVPIVFLTVPIGSIFAFHVECHFERLKKIAPELVENDYWKQLLDEAFQHAFDWVGFGAKTSVGYGAMQSDSEHQKPKKLTETESSLPTLKEGVDKKLMKEEEGKRDELDDLSESKKMLFTAKRCFEQLRKDKPNATLRDCANIEAKQLIKSAPKWKRNDEREEAASLLEHFYEIAGWHVPGAKKAQKERQKKKKLDTIARIRHGSE